MNPLIQFIHDHVETGACTCGRCGPVPENPGPNAEHTADLIFFKVAIKGEPDATKLVSLITQHKGEFADLNLFDGQDHSYINVGAWISDQGTALMLMGLGSLLKLWELRTPLTMIDKNMNPAMAHAMAGAGWVTICFTKNDLSHDVHQGSAERKL